MFITSLHLWNTDTLCNNTPDWHTMRIHGQIYFWVEPSFVRLMASLPSATPPHENESFEYFIPNSPITPSPEAGDMYFSRRQDQEVNPATEPGSQHPEDGLDKQMVSPHYMWRDYNIFFNLTTLSTIFLRFPDRIVKCICCCLTDYRFYCTTAGGQGSLRLNLTWHNLMVLS